MNINNQYSVKPSGVPWLGDMPAGWKIGRLGGLYVHRNEKVSDKDFPPLSVTMKGVIPQLATAAKSDDGDNRKLVRKGDFAINSRSDRRGACGISAYDGSVSLINTILKPRGQMSPTYFNWLFHTDAFADEFYKWGHGIVDDLWTTRWSEMKRIVVVLPPLVEQRAIADYLDKKCAAIDAAIAEAKKGIEEYKAWKKSLIFEAVTGKRRVGVFNAETQSRREAEKMKPSGIPWIGEIPEEWKVSKGRFIYDIATGKKDVNAEAPDCQYMFFTCSKTAKRIATYSFDCEALLVAGNGEVGFTQYYKGKFDAYQRTYVISGFRGVAPLFLRYYMSGLLPLQAQYNSVGSVIEFIKLGDLKGFAVTLPSLPEQQVIADYLDEKCAAIDAMVAEKEALIADLEAYKKSLIYETVTGKREVA